MIEAIAKLGLGGSVGVLIGMLAVWWVEPTTGQGAALLVAISVIFSTAVGGLISYFVRSKEIRAGSDEPGEHSPHAGLRKGQRVKRRSSQGRGTA